MQIIYCKLKLLVNDFSLELMLYDMTTYQVKFNAVLQYSTVQYSTVQYSTVHVYCFYFASGVVSVDLSLHKKINLYLKM